ncbi:MAG: flagellar hook-length control protein FliK [Deltaproteobacteria bacterium]|nr:flagellar hook-length control protein FliK [Deltaproteobacteria bacterium]
MDYLLGLQVRPVDETLGDALAFLSSEKAPVAEEKGRDPEALRNPSDNWLAGLVPMNRPGEILSANAVKTDDLENDPQGRVEKSSIDRLDQVQTNPIDKANPTIPESDIGTRLPTRQVLNLSAPQERREPSITENSWEGVVRHKLKLSRSVDPMRTENAVNRYQAVAVEANRRMNETEAKTDLNPSEVSTAKPTRGSTPEVKESDSKSKTRHDVSGAGARTAAVPFPTDATHARVDSVKINPDKSKTDRVTISEVFERVETLVHRGGGEMKLSLSPPELGKVEIHVSTQGNRVEVQMHSENSLAKSALENSLGDLRQSLHNHDLNLTRVEVFAGRETGFQFNAQADSSSGRHGFSENPSFSGRENRRQEFEVASPSVVNRFRAAARASGVDLRV